MARLHELARKYPRYGYRMIRAKLVQEGWRVNTKRIYRLWKQEGDCGSRKAIVEAGRLESAEEDAEKATFGP